MRRGLLFIRLELVLVPLALLSEMTQTRLTFLFIERVLNVFSRNEQGRHRLPIVSLDSNEMMVSVKEKVNTGNPTFAPDRSYLNYASICSFLFLMLTSQCMHALPNVSLESNQ